MAFNPNIKLAMTKEQKAVAVKVIKAILSVKVIGKPSNNEIVETTYRNWVILKGNSLEDFVEIINIIKEKYNENQS